jgi:hypothetical protein
MRSPNELVCKKIHPAECLQKPRASEEPLSRFSLTYENDELPDEIDLTTGSLDDPESFPPNRDVYPEEKLSWVRLVDGSFRHP